MNNDFNKKYPNAFSKESGGMQNNKETDNTVNDDISANNTLSNEFRDSLYDDITSLSSNANLIRSHVDTIILKTLEKCDRYGYEIIDLIADSTLNKYKIKQPTLYNCLKRLEKQGYINSYMSEEKSNGGRRKYYRLVEKGLNLLKQDKREWEFSRTILNMLLSDREVDLRAEDTPFESTSIKPLTKRIKISDDGLIKSNLYELENKDFMTYDPTFVEQNLKLNLSRIKSDFIESCLNDLKAEFDYKFSNGRTDPPPPNNSSESSESAVAIEPNMETANTTAGNTMPEHVPITIEALFKIIDEKLAHKESVVNTLISNIDFKSVDTIVPNQGTIENILQDEKNDLLCNNLSDTKVNVSNNVSDTKDDVFNNLSDIKDNVSHNLSDIKGNTSLNAMTSPYCPTEMSIDFSEITKALKLAINESNSSLSETLKEVIANNSSLSETLKEEISNDSSKATNSETISATIAADPANPTCAKEEQQSKLYEERMSKPNMTNLDASNSLLMHESSKNYAPDNSAIKTSNTQPSKESHMPSSVNSLKRNDSSGIYINKAFKDATFIAYLLFIIGLLVTVVLNKRIDISLIGLISLFAIGTIAPIAAVVKYLINPKKSLTLGKINWTQLYLSCGIAMALFITIFVFFIVLVGKNSGNNYIFYEKIMLCFTLSLIFPIFVLILKGMIKSSIYNSCIEENDNET